MDTTHSDPPDLSTLPGRLRALVAWSDLAPATFSVLAGLSKSHAGQVIRGTIRTLREDAVGKVADLTGAPRAWIAYGEGDPPAQADVAERVRKRLEGRATQAA